MAEYIEREAAKNAFPRAEADAFENCRYCTCLDSKQIGEILDNVPAADVVPVRHGRWIVSRTDYGWNGAEFPTHCKCDQCGREVPYQDRDNYCPNCGARMDGDGE